MADSVSADRVRRGVRRAAVCCAGSQGVEDVEHEAICDASDRVVLAAGSGSAVIVVVQLFVVLLFQHQRARRVDRQPEPSRAGVRVA